MTDCRSRPRHAGRFPSSFFGAATLAMLACGVPWTASAITIEDAVRQAITSNPTVLQAEADMRAAGHDVRQARAGYFPSLDLDTRYGREHTNIKQLSLAGNDVDDLWRRESGLTVTQLLWDGNATRSEVQRRVSLLNSAENSLADTRNALAFRAAEAYLDVLRNRELVELARANADSHARVLDNVQAKFSSGVGNKADVEQATARLALARSTVTAREGARLEARARYERVVGDAPPADLARPQAGPSGLVKAGAVDPAELTAATDSAQERALSDHPLVLQSTADVEAVQAAIKAARAGYHPQINLEGSLRRDNNLAGVAGNRNADALMVVARWNLFRGGADRARELAAAERKVSAQDQLEDAMRRIAENVAIAYQARATSESRIAFLGQHVASSEGTLQAYRAQFELNRRTLLDVLNAENELFNARSNLVIGTYDDIVNSYFVDASVGSLAGRFGGAGNP
jgi:adhesin transport system outer membrane protein